ncbi:MAG: DUF4013 domain-containing protein [Actinobacteria bacterium]|nr:DUF4013 domain-containing protein [Actinomycetota bacterium]
MDYNKAFTFIFNDPEWVKKALIFIVLSIFSFLIIPYLIASGYFIQTIRRVSAGEEGLPEWDDWGGLLTIGFKAFIIGAIITVPAIVLIGIFSFGAIVSAMSNSSTGLGLFGGGALVGIFLVSIYALVVACVGPAMIMQFARTDSIGAAFNVSEVLKIITDNLTDYVIAVAIMIGLFFAVSLAGSVIPLVGSLIFMPYAYEVSAHFFGQILASKTVPAEAGGAPA